LDVLAGACILYMVESVSLPDGGAPVRIEYSCEAMERIRRRALDAFRANPPLGIGGILLGTRHMGSKQLRLTGSVELPCSHTAGPAFHLTPPEKIQCKELVEANAPAAIGWYCSKTSGDAVLSESDLALYAELFPEPWSVALVLRPRAAAQTLAVFFCRAENRDILRLGECELVEWSPRSSASTSVPPGLFGVPGLQPPRPHRRKNRFLLKATGAAAAIVTAAAAVYVTQDSWLPRPPLTLTSAEVNGTVVFHWNPAATRGSNYAVLYLEDGGDLQTLSLDRRQLKSGVFNYTPKSEHVSARLDAAEGSAVTEWVGKVPAPPIR
jgi:hypothetical protein